MSKSREVLLDLLSGETTAQEAAEQLYAARAAEDLWLDYKSGAVVTKQKADKRDIRRVASAFANSEGGILLIGVVDDDQNRPETVDGVGAEADAAAWAGRTVESLLPYLSRPPLVLGAQLEGEPVILIVIDRSPQLVPVVEGGVARHYLRIAEHTPPIPDYLHADLRLGRRARPTLTIAATCGARWHTTRSKVSLTWSIQVSNDGLVWVDGLLLGAVGHGDPSNYNQHQSVGPVARGIRERVRGGELPSGALVDRSFLRTRLAPLSRIEATLQFYVRLKEHPMDTRWWRGLLFAVPDGGTPVLCQLKAEFFVNSRRQVEVNASVTELAGGTGAETWYGLRATHPEAPPLAAPD